MSLKTSSVLVGLALVALLVWLAVAHREDDARNTSGAEADTTSDTFPAEPTAASEAESSAPSGERSALTAARVATPSDSLASGSVCHLRVLDEDTHVLGDARVYTLDDEKEHRAGADALVTVPLPDDQRSDTLVWAPGHGAQRGVYLAPGRRDVVLLRDDGLRVAVVWADDGAPVAGAHVTVQPDDRFGNATLRVWKALPGAQATTDARGETTLFGVRCGWDKAALEVAHPQGPRVTVPARSLRDPDDELGIVRELRVEYPRDTDELEVVVHSPSELAPRLRVELRVLDGVYQLVRAGDDRFRLAGTSLRSMRAADAMYVRLSAHVTDGPDVLLAELKDPLESSLAQLRAREYAVAELSLRVSVSGASGAGRFEVTSAVARNTERARDLFGAWPPPAFQQSGLVWQSVPESGELDLTRGWRGPRTCVLLRLASTWEIVDATLAVPDRTAALRAPALGVLHVDVAAAEEIEGASLVCRSQEPRDSSRIEGYARPTPLTRGRNTLELARGRYKLSVTRHGAEWYVGEVTLSSEPVVRPLTLPAMRVVRGHAFGSTGSRETFSIRASDGTREFSSNAPIDVEGRFELRVPVERDMVVTLGWDCLNRAWKPCGIQVPLPRTLDVLEIERPDVLLRFVERESAEFAGFHTWNVRAERDAPSPTLNPEFQRDYGRTSWLEVALPPGTYVVQERAGAEVLDETRVTLARGESHTFEGTLSRAAFVSLVAAKVPGELVATATRIEGGDKLEFGSIGIPTEDSRKCTRGFVLAPGRYALVVKPPSATQKAWTREVRVVERDRLTFDVEF